MKEVEVNYMYIFIRIFRGRNERKEPTEDTCDDDSNSGCNKNYILL